MRVGKLRPLAVLAVLRELKRGAGDERPLGVAGARELVPLLARELRAGGDPGAVVEGRVEGVSALVWIGAPDEEELRRAARAGVPIVAVSDDDVLPYVLATDIVRVPRGSGFPVAEVAATLARKLGEDATALAARLPVLRGAVCDRLISSFARRNGITGVLVFLPFVDMPVLTLRQVRLVLRIAIAHGQELDGRRALEVLGVVGAGYGFRAVAREVLELAPSADWLVKGGVAYAGTVAVGEAAVRYFEAQSSFTR